MEEAVIKNVVGGYEKLIMAWGGGVENDLNCEDRRGWNFFRSTPPQHF